MTTTDREENGTAESPAEADGTMASAQGDPSALPGLEVAVHELVNYCPNTLLATKAVQTVRGEETTQYDTDRERQLRANIKIGLGITLVGLFCPIFWGSYLAGMTGDGLRWSAIHSGLVAIAGLLLAGYYRVRLGQLRRARPVAETSPTPDSD